MPFTKRTIATGPHPEPGYLDVVRPTSLANGAEVVPSFSKRIPFDSNGNASLDVEANNDAGTIPTGTYYLIAITTESSRRSFALVVEAGAGVIDLDTAIPSVVGQIGSSAASAQALNDHTTLATTAHGGLVAASDARLADARVPKGAAGGHLAGTYPNPALAVAPAGRRARIAPAQSVANAVDTKVAFNATTYDSGGVALSGNEHLVLPRAGRWMAVFNLRWATNAGSGNNVVAAWMLQNGAGDRLGYNEGIAIVTQTPTQNGAAIIRAALNDTLQLWVHQVSGAARELVVTSGMPYLEAVWLGP